MFLSFILNLNTKQIVSQILTFQATLWLDESTWLFTLYSVNLSTATHTLWGVLLLHFPHNVLLLFSFLIHNILCSFCQISVPFVNFSVYLTSHSCFFSERNVLHNNNMASMLIQWPLVYFQRHTAICCIKDFHKQAVKSQGSILHLCCEFSDKYTYHIPHPVHNLSILR